MGFRVGVLRFLLFVLFFSKFSWGLPSAPGASNCSDAWREYSHVPYQEVLFPETHVTYYRYQFEVKPDEPIQLRISGKFPRGRYFGFSLYDRATKGLLQRMPDTQLVANQKTDEKSAEVDYSILVHNADRSFLNEFRLIKSLYARSYEIWYRIYLPENVSDPLGGAGLPKIESLGSSDSEVAICPRAFDDKVFVRRQLSDAKRLPPVTGREGEIYFYPSKGANLYPNGDTRYLIARPATLLGAGPMLIQFRAPSTPLTAKGQPQVRYWSMCMVGGLSTVTSGCIADNEVQADAQGRVNILVGPENYLGVNLPEVAHKKGYAFLSHGAHSMRILLYRNVDAGANFSGEIPANLAWPPPEDADWDAAALSYRAQYHMGQYAPVAKVLTLSDLLQ